jgi:hypothetical protein
MKKLIICITLTASLAFAQCGGWKNCTGTSTSPIVTGYFTTVYSSFFKSTRDTFAFTYSTNVNDTVAIMSYAGTNPGIMTSNGGNRVYLYGGNAGQTCTGTLASAASAAQNGTLQGDYISAFSASTVLQIGGRNAKRQVALANTVGNTTNGGGWIIDSLEIKSIVAAGGKMGADSGRFNTVLVAKDTCLEVALFTRTCVRDTLSFMSGADSLTASYIVDVFATRGAITLKPYIAGVVGGKLVVDRPASDTNKYDRYSVTKIKQR